MEKFRKQIMIKLVLHIVFAVLMAATFLAVYHIYDEKDTFSVGYSAGFCSGLIGAVLVIAFRYLVVLRDTEKLKRIYVAETDERLRLIREKTASGSFTVSILILGFATVIATFFSDTVVCVLAAVIGVMVVIKIAFKFYYDRKY